MPINFQNVNSVNNINKIYNMNNPNLYMRNNHPENTRKKYKFINKLKEIN
jgi:hypothetical protein